MLAGLAVSGLMTPVIAAAVLVAFLLVSAEAYLATSRARGLTMAFLGVGPTELRVVIAAGALWALAGPLGHACRARTFAALRPRRRGGTVGLLTRLP